MTVPFALLLVVDDAVRGAIRFALDAEGVGVKVCSTIEELQRSGFPPGACMVLDQGPIGIDVIAVLRAARSQGIKAPAVILATTPTAKVLASARELGATILEKPLLGGELVTTIRALSGGGGVS